MCLYMTHGSFMYAKHEYMKQVGYTELMPKNITIMISSFPYFLLKETQLVNKTSLLRYNNVRAVIHLH